jgi:Tryptophanyl-tRNA synthetase
VPPLLHCATILDPKSNPLTPAAQTVLSGLRPTGRVHLGNYFGAVRNWVRLQDLHQCYYFVADWHALTSDYADTSKITQSTFDAVADWLAAGLDPARSTIFIQSEVKEHAELHLILSMVTPLPWLERVPTFKDQQAQLEDKDLNTYGFLGYPLLQTADIIIYRASFVPVGEDQASHLELSREIVAASTISTAMFSRSRNRCLRRLRRFPAWTGAKCRSRTATRSASRPAPTTSARSC